MPKSRGPRVSIFMVSSRDRSHSQRRDSVVSTIARTPPPAFLFPIQRCQRPDRLASTPLFSAGGRRRRLSSDRPLWCQSAISGFCDNSENPRIWPQKPPRAAEGLPSRSVTIRLRLGKILISKRTSSAFWRPSPFRFEPPPEREAAI
jgi:hypothetical protein